MMLLLRPWVWAQQMDTGKGAGRKGVLQRVSGFQSQHAHIGQVMLGRIAILKAILSMVRTLTAGIVGPMTALTKVVRVKIDEINAQQIVFFTRGDNIANLNNAMLYVRQNEHTNRLKIVTVVNDEVKEPEGLAKELEFLDQAYPEIDIEYVSLEGHFSPQLIQKLSDEWNIPKNLMFIGSPGGRLPYDLGELGGVRLII